MRTRPRSVECYVCKKRCGMEYPDYPATFMDPPEPGYREGIGEDFTVGDHWHCSEECKQITVKDLED